MNIRIERKQENVRAARLWREKINTEEKIAFQQFSNHKHAFYKCARQLWDKQFNYDGLITVHQEENNRLL